MQQDSLEDTKCGMIEIEKVFEKSWISAVFICGILSHENCLRGAIRDANELFKIEMLLAVSSYSPLTSSTSIIEKR